MKYFLLVTLILSCPVSLLCQEWQVETKSLSFECSCQMYASEILVGLKGGCSGDDFYKTDEGRIECNNNRVCFVLSSWEDFSEFNGKYFKSDFFDIFKKEYFYDHRLVVVYVIYTGSQFIKNDQLYENNEECGFSYEIWDKEVEYIPACAWETLYVIQLKK